MEPVRQVLRSLDPEVPVIEMLTLHEEVETSLWQERLLSWLSAIFGAIAALLASIGLYGTLDYAVKSRARELAVRIALGAPSAGIAGLVSRGILLFTGSGVVLGLCAYAATAFWIRRVLYDVGSPEATAAVSVAVFVLLMCALAAAPAAYRAARIDPAIALRSE